MSSLRYEICVESIEGVQAAVAAGADRIELCADLEVGGVTPTRDLVDRAVDIAAGRVAVHVLVRPRAGDFSYDADEVRQMLTDIANLRRAGVDGLVVGALDHLGAIDTIVSRRLVEAARPAAVTFHRAFDASADLDVAFDAVLNLGVDRLLTSGGAPTALEGADIIAGLIDLVGNDLIVMPGSGVTETTAAQIIQRTGARELHFSGRAPSADGAMLAKRMKRIMAATS